MGSRSPEGYRLKYVLFAVVLAAFVGFLVGVGRSFVVQLGDFTSGSVSKSVDTGQKTLNVEMFGKLENRLKPLLTECSEKTMTNHCLALFINVLPNLVPRVLERGCILSRSVTRLHNIPLSVFMLLHLIPPKSYMNKSRMQEMIGRNYHHLSRLTIFS